MFIKGIGTVLQKDIKEVLSAEAIQSIKDGTLTWEEAGALYKSELTRRLAKCGSYYETYAANSARIPDNLKEILSPEDLAALVDAFYACYSDGKSAGQS